MLQVGVGTNSVVVQSKRRKMITWRYAVVAHTQAIYSEHERFSVLRFSPIRGRRELQATCNPCRSIREATKHVLGRRAMQAKWNQCRFMRKAAEHAMNSIVLRKNRRCGAQRYRYELHVFVWNSFCSALTSECFIFLLLRAHMFEGASGGKAWIWRHAIIYP